MLAAGAQRLAEQPTGIVGLVRHAGDLGVDLREAVPVERQRVAEERLDRLLDGVVPRAREPGVVVERGGGEQIAQRARMQEADRRAAAE